MRLSSLFRKPAARPDRRFRPGLQLLEGREVPATWVVDTPLDVVDANDGVRSLREAIAQASPKGGDTISFAPALAGQTLTLTQGKLLIDRGLTIQGPTAAPLAISAGGGLRAVEVAARTKVSLSDLTIRDAVADGINGFDRGGGILNAGTLKLTNCTLTNNHASWYGGAVYNTGTLTVVSCTFSGNSVGGAGSGYGGAIYSTGSVAVDRCTFADNSAWADWGSGNGGAICNDLGGAMTVTGSAFTGNSAKTEGGAIQNVGTMTVTGCSFTGNIAQYGGAILVRGTLTIGGCSFADNVGGDVVKGSKVAKITWL